MADELPGVVLQGNDFILQLIEPARLSEERPFVAALNQKRAQRGFASARSTLFEASAAALLRMFTHQGLPNMQYPNYPIPSVIVDAVFEVFCGLRGEPLPLTLMPLQLAAANERLDTRRFMQPRGGEAGWLQDLILEYLTDDRRRLTMLCTCPYDRDAPKIVSLQSACEHGWMTQLKMRQLVCGNFELQLIACKFPNLVEVKVTLTSEVSRGGFEHIRKLSKLRAFHFWRTTSVPELETYANDQLAHLLETIPWLERAGIHNYDDIDVMIMTEALNICQAVLKLNYVYVEAKLLRKNLAEIAPKVTRSKLKNSEEALAKCAGLELQELCLEGDWAQPEFDAFVEQHGAGLRKMVLDCKVSLHAVATECTRLLFLECDSSCRMPDQNGFPQLHLTELHLTSRLGPYVDQGLLRSVRKTLRSLTFRFDVNALKHPMSSWQTEFPHGPELFPELTKAHILVTASNESIIPLKGFLEHAPKLEHLVLEPSWLENPDRSVVRFTPLWIRNVLGLKVELGLTSSFG